MERYVFLMFWLLKQVNNDLATDGSNKLQLKEQYEVPERSAIKTSLTDLIFLVSCFLQTLHMRMCFKKVVRVAKETLIIMRQGGNRVLTSVFYGRYKSKVKGLYRFVYSVLFSPPLFLSAFFVQG
jgi:hypothetical protein